MLSVPTKPITLEEFLQLPETKPVVNRPLAEPMTLTLNPSPKWGEGL